MSYRLRDHLGRPRWYRDTDNPRGRHAAAHAVSFWLGGGSGVVRPMHVQRVLRAGGFNTTAFALGDLAADGVLRVEGRGKIRILGVPKCPKWEGRGDDVSCPLFVAPEPYMLCALRDAAKALAVLQCGVGHTVELTHALFDMFPEFRHMARDEDYVGVREFDFTGPGVDPRF